MPATDNIFRVKSHDNGTFKNMDFAEYTQIYASDNDLLFLNCRNIPEIKNAYCVRFEKCDFEKTPKIEAETVYVTKCRNFNAFGVLSFPNASLLVNGCPAFVGASNLPVRSSLHVINSKTFKGVSQQIQDLYLTNCKGLSTPVKINGIFEATKCSFEKKEIEITASRVHLNNVVAKKVVARQVNHNNTGTDYFSITGSRATDSVDIDFPRVRIIQKKIKHLKTKGARSLVLENMEKLTNLEMDNTYKELYLTGSTSVVFPLPSRLPDSLMVDKPHPDQKGFQLFSIHDRVCLLTLLNGKTYLQHNGSWYSKKNLEEIKYHAPEGLSYKGHLRRKFELAVTGD